MRDRLPGPSTSLTPDGPVGTGRVAHLKFGDKHNRALVEIGRARRKQDPREDTYEFEL